MDKVKLEFKIPKNVTIEYNGIEVVVFPYLDTATQIVLINSYLRDFFVKEGEGLIISSETDFLTAEFKMMNYILQVCTNIDTDDINGDIYSDPFFWEKIISTITNYQMFRERLSFILEEIRRQIKMKLSTGIVLSEFVEKFYKVLDNFSNITPEELENARKTGIEIMEELKKSNLLGSVPEKEQEKKEQ